MKGRKTGEGAAFPEGMLESVVTADQRIKKELAPAAEAIKASVSFNEFQRIRAENPGASADEIIQIWKTSIAKAGDDYAAKLLAYMRSRFDDFMAVARFRTRDGRFGEPQKIGLGPTSDESAAINGSYKLAAFRNREVIKTLRIWASAIRAKITKHAAAELWNKKLRFRRRYKDFEKHINESREFF